MGIQFTPDPVRQNVVNIPYFEDVSTEKHGLKGHRTRKSIRDLENEIRDMMGRLGGGVTSFVSGTFSATPLRYGIRVEFVLGSARGRIDVAALPMRGRGDATKEAALKQALVAVRDMLQAQYDTLFFLPGAVPLVPYLLGPNGKTVTEMLVENGNLPLLSGPSGEVVEGEYM